MDTGNGSARHDDTCNIRDAAAPANLGDVWVTVVQEQS